MPQFSNKKRIHLRKTGTRALQRDMGSRDYRELARKFGAYMRTLPGWQEVSMTKHAVNLYGRQKGFKRVADLDDDEEL